MSIEIGSRFQISQAIQEYLNSAETLTVISNNGVTIQFSLGDAKGHGSMPIEHFQYLQKKLNLKIIP
ncbi:hypothetical protein, partial [Bacillus sp. JJ1764]|uniref:hypothetical protein n=1 Tax=Bacillus sp. JJ1764 TaxID=3122964 RepID=UPI002FFEC107